MKKATIGAGSSPALKPNRLFDLPKLADVRKRFEIPAFDLPAIKTGCVNCKKTLKTETDYCQSVEVCKVCLSVYSAIDRALNRHAEAKATAAKRAAFLQKVEGFK